MSEPVSGRTTMDTERALVLGGGHKKSHIQSLAWRVNSVQQQNCKPPRVLLSNINGMLYAGECCALMGPSGSGKTTLLNTLANRQVRGQAIDSSIVVNGATLKPSDFRRVSCFVEHEVSLIGGLTVFETISFASKLASSTAKSKDQRLQQIHDVLQSFGLIHEANTIIQTPFRKGISHGQKRRLAVSTQMVTAPNIVFLDEPTSGLDSTSAYEVIDYLQKSAKRHNLIVICSIHQPSVSTLALFNKALFISQGQQCYFGPIQCMTTYFHSVGLDMARQHNPAEFLLETINMDFAQDGRAVNRRASDLHIIWQSSSACTDLEKTISDVRQAAQPPSIDVSGLPSMHRRIMVLLHRSFIKAYRDPLAYGIRLAFAISFALLIGTVWYHLSRDQESIESVVTEIYFAPSFLSLAAMIYGPAFIEDYSHYRQDVQNGLYGPTEFLISNFIVGTPFLFLTSLIFSIICYWLSNLLSSTAAFFTWVLWIFVTTLVAESVVVLAVSIFPDFMFTIAFSSFVNSILICTQGFFIPYTRLNVFYRYGFYYWNYLSYAFQGLMMTQFKGVSYSCSNDCKCLYSSDLASQCQVAGQVVLKKYGLNGTDELAKNIAFVIAIIVGFRIATWIILEIKRK